MTYYRYDPSDLIIMIGSQPKDIYETINHYSKKSNKKLQNPTIDDILEISGVHLEVKLPFFRKDHFIDINISDSVQFRINANAYFYFQCRIQEGLENRRGSLYKFKINSATNIFFPESIMQGLNYYDWGKHQDEVAKCLKIRDFYLKHMEDEHGFIFDPTTIYTDEAKFELTH